MFWYCSVFLTKRMCCHLMAAKKTVVPALLSWLYCSWPSREEIKGAGDLVSQFSHPINQSVKTFLHLETWLIVHKHKPIKTQAAFMQ